MRNPFFKVISVNNSATLKNMAPYRNNIVDIYVKNPNKIQTVVIINYIALENTVKMLTYSCTIYWGQNWLSIISNVKK
jgi:hypothetical protein